MTVNENLRGQAYDLYIEDAIQETTVATAGVSAEYGRFGGGVVNIVTKSGGNRFSGSFRDTLNNDQWRKTDTPFEQSRGGGLGGSDLRIDKVVPTYEYTFGGPVLRDRLWFFTAGRVQKQESGRNTAITGIPYTFIDDTKRFEFKGTYALNTNHRFQAAYTKNPRTQENNTFNLNLSMDLASLGTRELPGGPAHVELHGLLTPEFLRRGALLEPAPELHRLRLAFTDFERGTLLIDRSRGNTRYWTDTFCGVCDTEQRDNEDLFVKGTYFLSTAAQRLAQHDVRLRQLQRQAARQQPPVGQRLPRSSGRARSSRAPAPSTVIYPQFLGDGSTIIQWNPIRRRQPRLELPYAFGVLQRRLARLRSPYGEPRRAVRQERRQDQAGKTVITDYAWSPRLGVVFDPTGDGEWALTGSVAKYVTAISNSIADASSAAGNPEDAAVHLPGAQHQPGGHGESRDPGRRHPAAVRRGSTPTAARTCRSTARRSIPGVSPASSAICARRTAWEYATGVNRQFGSRAASAPTSCIATTPTSTPTRDTSRAARVTPEGRSYDLIVDRERGRSRKRRMPALTSRAPIAWSMASTSAATTRCRATGAMSGSSKARRSPKGRCASRAAFPEYKQRRLELPGRRPPTTSGTARSCGSTTGRAYRWPDPEPAPDTRERRPYGGGGRTVLAPNANSSGVDPRPYVTNPGYLAPPAGNRTSYYYTARDAFRTEAQIRTDFAANYVYRLPGRRRPRGIRPGAGAEPLQPVPAVRLRRDGVWYRQRGNAGGSTSSASTRPC